MRGYSSTNKVVGNNKQNGGKAGERERERERGSKSRHKYYSFSGLESSEFDVIYQIELPLASRQIYKHIKTRYYRAG